jgi:PAS domain S-box-containing protein
VRPKILDYFDFEKANVLLEGFNQSTGFVTAILDLDGTILSKSGWRQICTDFHRKNPETAANCSISDTELANKVEGDEKYHFYECLNGLVDVKAPIVIKGEHIANLYSGQFFFDHPDLNFFINQAKTYGFDETSYLEALAKVPIVSKEKVEEAMKFLLDIVETLIEITNEKIEQIELNEKIRKNETDLLESQAQLKQTIGDLIESQRIAHLGTWRLDISTNQVVWSEELYKMYGFDPSIPPPPYTEHMKLFTPESWGKLSTALERTSKLGIPYELELETVKPDGSNGWMWVRGEAEKDSNGIIVTLHGAAQDITERKKIEYVLRESEEKFQLLFTQAPVAYLALDSKAYFIEVNEKWLDTFGYNKEEVIGKWFGDFLCPEYVDAFRQRFEQFKDNGHITSEVEILSKDGRKLLIAFTGKIAYETNGEFRQTHGIMQDITEQRKVEKALIESEKKYSSYIESAPNAVYITDNKGRYLDVNDTMTLMTGYSREELLKMNWRDLTADESKNNAEEQYRILTENGSMKCQLKYIHKNGSKRWRSLDAVRLSEDKYLSFSSDTTEHKQIENDLSKSEERFRVAQEISPDGFTILQPVRNEAGETVDFTWVYENQAIARINQTDPQKVIGKRLLDLFPSHSGTSIFEAYKKVADTGETQIIGEINVGDVISKPIWLRLVVESMGEDIVILSQDISEQKERENELRDSEERFRLLVETAPDAVFLLVDRSVSYANPAAIRMLKAESLKDLIGKPITTWIHQSYLPGDEEHLRVLLEERKSIAPMEQIFVLTEGTEIPVEITAKPIQYQNAPGALIYVRDQTEQKQREEKRLADIFQTRQHQKLESIGTLASGVAHEINNPIMGILNYAQLIIDEKTDPSISEFAQEIIWESNRIAEITKDLLYYSRQQKQTHSPADINDIIQRTLSLINGVLKKDQIEVKILTSDDLPTVKCRSQQIQQILMNLLTNARDALNEKYPDRHPDKMIIIETHLFEDQGRRWMRITIEDHGNGIPKEAQTKLFDPFYTTKSREIGTGLGLSISYGLARDHHGQLNFETMEGQFTKFHLIIPVDNGWDLEKEV